MANYDDLVEALGTSNVLALIKKAIDPDLLDLKRSMSPLRDMLPHSTWETPEYFWDQVTSVPQAQSTTETPTTTQVAATNSNYAQQSVKIKHTQVQGDVGKFAIKTATATVVNLLDVEMKRQVKSLAWHEDILHLYGSAVATLGSLRPQWDGMDQQVSSSNVLNANASTLSSSTPGTIALADLDNLYDQLVTKVAEPLQGQNYAYLMSPPMMSEISRILYNNHIVMDKVQLQPIRDDGTQGSDLQTIDGGIEVNTYRGIPIVEATTITPHSATWGSAAAALNAVSNSTAFAATTRRHYRIEAVDALGITVATADFYTGVLNDADHGVDITSFFPTVTDYLGNSTLVHSFRVYLVVSSGTTGVTGHTLYGIVSAYDQLDNKIDTIRDNGQNIVGSGNAAGQIVGFQASAGVASGVGGLYTGNATASAGDGVNGVYTQPGGGKYVEKIRLITRNPDFIRVPTVTELESDILAPTNPRSIQCYALADLALAVRSPYFIAMSQGCQTG
jgi:hypothetical protein